MLRTIIILFITGALIGNAYNSFHAFSGTVPVTTTHINPLLDYTSYLLFGFAGVAIGLTNIVLDRWFKTAPQHISFLNLISALGFLGVFYFLSACLFLGNVVISLILLGGFILSGLIYNRSAPALLAALLVAIAGTATEITLVHDNLYYYTHADFMGVAWWLPFLYGIASITTGQLARAAIYHFKLSTF